MKLFNRKIPTPNSPSIIIHIYYMMISFTFCYVYYHKFITKADFFGVQSSGGIYAVLDGIAVKPIQFRILIPYVFKVFKSILFFVPDKAVFFILTIVLCYFVLLIFYFLLNEYFQSKAHNCWLSPIIIYPMMWNFVIANGQFFYMDLSALFVIVCGFYLIVKEKSNWLLVLFLLGVLNHPSAGYLIIAFLLFNIRKLFSFKTILYSVLMCIIYLGYYILMDSVFSTTHGYFVVYNLPRNLSLLSLLPPHIIVRDLVFTFGGLHFFILIFFFSGQWRRFKSPMLLINLTIVPYIISVLINFSVEELRNYIAIIPFIVIIALIFLSTFENSFLKPVDKLKSKS